MHTNKTEYYSSLEDIQDAIHNCPSDSCKLAMLNAVQEHLKVRSAYGVPMFLAIGYGAVGGLQRAICECERTLSKVDSTLSLQFFNSRLDMLNAIQSYLEEGDLS